MHSILIVLSLPATNSKHIARDTQYAQDWQTCCKETQDTLKKYPETKLLGGNVFLIPAKTHLHVAAEILANAKSFHLKHQSLFLEEEPQWIESPDF